MNGVCLSRKENDSNYFKKQWDWHKNSKKQKSHLKINDSCYNRLHSEYATVQISLVYQKHTTQVVAAYQVSGIVVFGERNTVFTNNLRTEHNLARGVSDPALVTEYLLLVYSPLACSKKHTVDLNENCQPLHYRILHFLSLCQKNLKSYGKINQLKLIYFPRLSEWCN